MFDDFLQKYSEILLGNFEINELDDIQYLKFHANATAFLVNMVNEDMHKRIVVDNDVFLAEGEKQDRLYSQRGGIRRKAQSKASGFWEILCSSSNG